MSPANVLKRQLQYRKHSLKSRNCQCPRRGNRNQIGTTAEVNPRTNQSRSGAAVALVQPCSQRHRGDLISLPAPITFSLSFSLNSRSPPSLLIPILPPSLCLYLSMQYARYVSIRQARACVHELIGCWKPFKKKKDGQYSARIRS